MIPESDLDFRASPEMRTTQGWLLGGRVRYAQPETGFRSGIEPVLLAAFVPARAGQRVLEGGTGAGAGLLCLSHRVPGLSGEGIEREAGMADLARQNLAANGAAGFVVRTGDLTAPSAPVGAEFDHAFANPPYHAAGGTASPDPLREAAKRAGPGLLAAWARALARRLRRRGTLSLILPAAALPEALAAIEAAGCGSPCVMPLWPACGRPARLLLLRGLRGGRGACRLLPGLALHGPGGGYTPEAARILRDGEGLEG
jgi:tRNA1Val (adenine37-N6)-methyltransferase